jgi:hypothetical protein
MKFKQERDMKKSALLLFVFVLGLSAAGCGDPCKEDMFTKLGDNLATMGKEGLEKDRILLERSTKRAGECAEKGAGDMKKKMGL